MTTQIGMMAYVAVFIFTFFASSFLVARCTHESPTEPTNFGVLIGTSLVWPIAVPLTVAIFLLFGIACLAKSLASR